MSVPVEKLEETLNTIAKRLAMYPAELLYLNKLARNKSVEIMGLFTAIEFNGQLHVYSHTFPSTQKFSKDNHEKGHGVGAGMAGGQVRR